MVVDYSPEKLRADGLDEGLPCWRSAARAVFLGQERYLPFTDKREKDYTRPNLVGQGPGMSV
jgi:hypothetical protein